MLPSVYELYKRKIIVTSDSAVIFTECRCDMNDTGTIAHGNVVVTGYENELSFSVLLLPLLHMRKAAHILCIPDLFLCSFSRTSYAGSSSSLQACQELCPESFCHIICVSVCCFYFAVSLIRVYAECNVGRKCPGVVVHAKEICIFSDNLESYNCGTFFYSFVSLGTSCAESGVPQRGQ